MYSIYISLFTFFFTFILQLILVRMLRRMQMHVFISFAIFLLGFIVLLMLVYQRDFFYTSILIYILLTMLLMTASPIPLLGGCSSAYVIVRMLEKEKKVTMLQLYGAFDEKELILKRLEDLVDVGLVRNHGNIYFVSKKGLLVNRSIELCGLLMGLKTKLRDSGQARMTKKENNLK